MRGYADIKQSRRLAEILPHESADMYWDYNFQGQEYKYYPKVMDDQFDDVCTPCWSLAALLDVLPLNLIVNNHYYAFSMIKGLNKNGETYAIKYAIFNTTYYFHRTDYYNNPVDACVAMIEKLHERNLL